MTIPSAFPGVALVAAVEHLVEGRRVVIFGDCTSDVPDALIDRGARLVHVYDDDLGRVSEASARGGNKDISYAPLGQSTAARDGAFDFGIVLDLGAFEDGQKLITRLRRALAPRGVALVVSPNPEASQPVREGGPGYYELYEWVSGEFDEVRMLGQLPFEGSAIVDFGAEGDPDFTLDTTFVQGREPDPTWYLAVASHFPVAVDAYTVVQLPPRGDASEPTVALRELEDARRDNAQLQAEVERLRKVERTTQKAPRNDDRVNRLEAALSERDASLGQRDALLSERDALLSERDALLRDLETRLGEAQRRIEQAEEEATEAQTALRAARADAAAATKQHRAEAERLRQEVPKVDSAELGQAHADVAALEAQLRERGQECQRLNEALRVSEKLAGELLSELDSWKDKARGALPDPSLAELEEELNRARSTEAQRVADLTTAQWTIQRLENQLDEARGAQER